MRQVHEAWELAHGQISSQTLPVATKPPHKGVSDCPHSHGYEAIGSQACTPRTVHSGHSLSKYD